MKIQMKRGDTREVIIGVPKAIYSPGTVITFMAKPGYDNDSTNAAALINKTFGDADIISQDGEKVTYRCVIAPADTRDLEIKIDKKKSSLKLIGEFELRTPAGVVRTLPMNDGYVELMIYPDIKMGS